MVNKVILVGNLGKDPESKELKGGNNLCKFSMATTEKYKKDGEWVDKTEWHNVVVWGQPAKFVEQYLKKGDRVYVEGKIQTRKYEKDGEDRYMTEINAYQVKGMSEKQQSKTKAKSSDSPKPEGADDEDDLPF